MDIHSHQRSSTGRGFCLGGFCSKSHARTIEGIEWSLARFYLNDEELFRAWGVKADLHCSAHLYCFDTQPRIGCPTVAVEDDEGGVGFLVLGENEKRYPVSIRKRL